MKIGFFIFAALTTPDLQNMTTPYDCPHPSTDAWAIFEGRGETMNIEITREEFLAFEATRAALNTEADNPHLFTDHALRRGETLLGRPIGKVRWLEIMRQHEKLEAKYKTTEN